MIDQTTPPQPPADRPLDDVPAVPQKPQRKFPWVAGGLLGVGFLIFGFLYTRGSSQRPEEPTPVITPTEVPVPTPLPNLSRIATTGAFLSYSEEIASFSAILTAFPLQDNTLAPPVLDLELGL